MSQLSVSALGVFEAVLDGTPLPSFRTRKSAALLVFLAYERQAPHPRERLMHLFWPDADVKAAQTNLRQVLYHLRRGIPEVGTSDGGEPVPLVLSNRATLQLNPAADMTFDVHRFRDLLQAVHRHDHEPGQACPACRERLETAATLYRGDFLQDLQLDESAPFADWSRQVREGLRADFLETLDRLAELLAAEGDLAEALQWARRLVREDELHEEGHRWLMRLLARQGLRNEALNQYAACRRLLASELGVEPSAETALLAEEIAEGRAVREEAAAIPSRVYAPLTPFFGRQSELDELRHLLEEQRTRLIEIIGPGGVGKTRLALAFLRQVESRFEEGVLHVPLVSVADTPAGLHTAIAEAVGLPLGIDGGGTGRFAPLDERLAEHLAARQMLILLDNFESVLAQTPQLLRLLKRAPRINLLVTSREKMPVAGAYHLRLGGLGYPSRNDTADDPGRFPAIQLFLYAARSAGLGHLDEVEVVQQVAELCRLLDGQPLALELAAEWVDVMSLSALLKEIRRGYDVLVADRADLEPRHRSMRAVLEATWERLAAAEQSLFQKLCIFRGGFTRSAAREVAATQEPGPALLRLLAGLVDKSLVTYRPRDDRYVIHELLRQYGEERLSQKRALLFQLENRHASYYTDWLDQQWLRLRGAESAAAQAAIDAEFANLRHAWQWATEQGALWILNQLAQPLGWYMLWRGRHQEGLELYASAAERVAGTSAPPVRRRRLLILLYTWEAALRGRTGDTRKTVALLDQCRSRLQALDPVDDWLEAFVELQSGRYLFESDRTTAQRCFLEALKVVVGTEDRWLEGHIHYWLGRVFHSETDFERAEFEFQASHDIFHALNDRRHLAETHIYQGFNAARQGRLAEADSQTRHAEQLWLAAGNRVAVAETKRHLAPLCFWRGEVDEARRLCEESLEELQALGIGHHTPFLEMSIAVNAFFQSNLADAAAHGIHALAVCRDAQAVREEILTLCILGGVALLEHDLHVAHRQLENALVLGRQRGMIGEAMFTEAFLGFVDLAEERHADALARGMRLLRHIVLRRAFMTLSMALPFLIALFLEMGDLERALSLWELVTFAPLAGCSPLLRRLVEGPLADALAAAEDLEGPHTLEGRLAIADDPEPYVIVESLLSALEQQAQEMDASTDGNSSATMRP